MTLSPRVSEPVRHAPVPLLEQNSGDAIAFRHLEKWIWRHNSVVDGPIWTKFGRRITDAEWHADANANVIRQDRKALWHNDCPSHNLLRHLTLTHDHANKRGEVMQQWKTKKNNLTQSSQRTKKRDIMGPIFTLRALHPGDALCGKNYHSRKVHLTHLNDCKISIF